MNNQNDNKTNTSNTDQDLLNQYASSIKPDEKEDVQKNISAQPKSIVSETKESLKEFNATPIDTPTPISLDDSLDSSKNLGEETMSIIKDESKLAPELETTNKLDISVDSKSIPEPDLNTTPKSQPDPKIEITPEPEIQTQPIAESSFQPESEVELKTEPEIIHEMDSGYNPEPQPTIQTETNPINQPQEDPEKIKQKIEEVLSYSTTNSVVNSPSDKPKTSSFIKTLFIFSLIIFIAIVGALAYFLVNPISTTNSETKNTPTDTPTQTTIPTQTSVVCELNGFIYNLDQSFPSADGCNTCTCVSADNITCTEKDCDDTISPATQSATITPTVSTESSIKKTTPVSTKTENTN